MTARYVFLNRKTNQIDYVIERGEDGSSKVYDVLKDEKEI